MTDAPGDSLMPKVLANGEAYLLLWSDARAGVANVFSAQLSSAGAKQSPEASVTAATSTAARPTAVDVGGGNWMAAWEELAAGDAVSVLARKLQDAGAPTQVMNDGFQQARPGLASIGGQPVLVWMTMSKSDPNGATISAARLTAAGAMMGAPVAIGAGAPAHYPAVAASDSAIGIAYVAGAGQVKLALLDGSLAVTREIVVRDDPTAASNPALAWDGQRWIVAWEDLRGGTEESVYAARVGGDGVVSDAQLVSAASDGSANWPQIAVGNGLAVIAYYGFPSDAEIMLRALGPDGAPRGAAPVRVSESSGKARFPSVAFLPGTGEFGVSWNDNRDGNPEIYFARVSCSP